jgi:hypothetical protein
MLGGPEHFQILLSTPSNTQMPYNHHKLIRNGTISNDSQHKQTRVVLHTTVAHCSNQNSVKVQMTSEVIAIHPGSRRHGGESSCHSEKNEMSSTGKRNDEWTRLEKIRKESRHVVTGIQGRQERDTFSDHVFTYGNV